MTGKLNTDLNLTAPDDVYEVLIDAHRGLTAEQSLQVNARLILLLINHIGDGAVIGAALARARVGIVGGETKPDLKS